MGRKIIDLIHETHAAGDTVVSFEFFPAKTEAGVDNLLARIQEMSIKLCPTFVTLTWRSAFKNEELWLKIGSKVQNDFGIDILMHLTCHLPKNDLRRILRRLREAGIRNVLALRGDPPLGTETWRPVADGLQNAYELVKFIREEHGDYFCVAVAGYPEAHIECWNSPTLPPSEQSKSLDLERLKMKVDAGADFVVTQFFYDVELFLEFTARCRSIGVRVPILPGYMVIQTYNGFAKFTKWCRTTVPTSLHRMLNNVKEDDTKVKVIGVQHGVTTCQRLLDAGCKSLHFYTMNLERSVKQILEALHLVVQGRERSLPWRSGPIRDTEQVRPIFWSQRPASYLHRTADWDEFPNGRWGDARSPAYGDLTDYYLSFKRAKVDRRKLWGTPQTEIDIRRVFVAFVTGRINQLPWADTVMASESTDIIENLRWMNEHGFLTINSQPKVNGLPSSDPTFGWGGDGGFVFQKAYVEFFVAPEMFKKLENAFKRHPNLTYHAVNYAGDEYTNSPSREASAVTWGVFPGKEIQQPTVVDPVSFNVWKSEAFDLWTSQWAAIYPEQSVDEAATAATATAKDSGSASGTSATLPLHAASPSKAVAATPMDAGSPLRTALVPTVNSNGGASSTSGSPSRAESSDADRPTREAVSRALIERVQRSYFLVNVVDNAYASPGSDIFRVFREVVVDEMQQDELRSQVFALQDQTSELRERCNQLASMHQDTVYELQVTKAAVAEREAQNEMLRLKLRELEAQLLSQPGVRIVHAQSNLPRTGASSFTSPGIQHWTANTNNAHVGGATLPASSKAVPNAIM